MTTDARRYPLVDHREDRWRQLAVLTGTGWFRAERAGDLKQRLVHLTEIKNPANVAATEQELRLMQQD